MFFFSKNNAMPNGIKLNKPDYCEFEEKKTFFHEIDKTDLTDPTNPRSIVTYECMSCERFICVEYNLMTRTPVKYDYNFSKPDFPFDKTATKILESISPRFIKIYKQASIVEKMELDEIDRFSYRKAIEILINDFLKSIGKSDEELKNKSMAQKIKNLPDNDLFRPSIPQLISWIGNDGAHVYEKNPELTIENMKEMIYYFVICLTAIKTNEKYSKLANKIKDKK